jgi:hypothetical protein
MLADACLRDPRLWNPRTARPSWLPPIIRREAPAAMRPDPATGLFLPWYCTITIVGTPFMDGQGSTSGFTTTTSFDSTGADFICGVSLYGTGAAEAFSDNKGNSWTQQRNDVSANSNTGLALNWTLPTTVGAGHTFTEAANFARIGILALSGVAQTFTIIIDDGSASDPNTVATWNPTSGYTPGFDGSIQITGVSEGFLDRAPTITAPFTVAAESHDPTASNAIEGGFGYSIQTNAVPVNPTWTGATFNYYMIANIMGVRAVGSVLPTTQFNLVRP